jgi:hypothetical protein
MYPTAFHTLNDAWIVHALRVDTQSQLAGPRIAAEFSTNMPVLPLLRANAHVQLDLEYVGDLIAGDRFHGILAGTSADEARERQTLAFMSDVIRPSRPLDLLARVGEIGHELILRRGELFYRGLLPSRTAINDALADVDHEGAIQQPPAPIMVSLRVNPSGILYGTEERSGAVLFELGADGVKCNLKGYVPSWWKTIDEDAAA